MIQTKTITLGETTACVEFESNGITDITLHRINGQRASTFSFADQVAVQGQLMAVLLDECITHLEVRP